MIHSKFVFQPAALRSVRTACVLLALHTMLASFALGQTPSNAVPQWIWTGNTARDGQVVFFRRAIEVTGPVKRIELRGAADNRMIVYWNGHQVAEIENYQRLAVVDLTAQAREGENLLAVRGYNDSGPAGVIVKVDIEDARGERTIVSDAAWRASEAAETGWESAAYDASAWRPAVSLGKLGVAPWGDPTGEVDDYNQWKQALGGSATDPATLELPPGFEAELLRSAKPEEGSWVSLAVDPRGRLIIARETKGLLRLSLPAEKSNKLNVEVINDTLEECRGLLFAHGALYVNANNSKGLYRLRDTNGDDQFDEVQLLRATGGSVGHGRNDLALGPDGMIYLAHGDDVRLPDNFQPGHSPLRNDAVDRLITSNWDQHLFNSGFQLPPGHIIRTDADGKRWEVVAGGLRNPFGIDFHPDGEMFTYDADMEWDVGAPWYRPTRVNHLVSGGDYGWRQGTRNWPAWYPDSLPSNLDIGKGSPTAVKFGTRSHFPPEYRRALFILDWAYGRILAVHLRPLGASYTGRAETFVKGRPLNVTDLEFGPDGAMYFVTGGRGTQSGLYRVRYTGAERAEIPPSAEEQALAQRAAEARALRRRLEAFHGRIDPSAVATVWPHLDSDDPWIRHAARVALEHQPIDQWQQRVADEARPTARCTALLAWARVGTPESEPRWLAELSKLELEQLSAEQKIIALRAYAVGLLRMGAPDTALASQLRSRLLPLCPDSSAEVNQLLAELLVYLHAPEAPATIVQMLDRAATQEERLHYLYVLQDVRGGWTLDARRSYLQWLRRAHGFEGAQYMPRFVQFIKDAALATLSAEERGQLATEIAALEQPLEPLAPEAGPTEPRPFVRDWKLEDLLAELDAVGKGRNYEQGKRMYEAALCSRCHQLGLRGRAVGPDLTSAAQRFSRRDLLESILVPSKAIDDKYRDTRIVTSDGKIIAGKVLRGDDHRVVVATDPLDANQTATIARDAIAEQAPSAVSPMPLGLLNTLSREEILDLLAYLEAAGDPTHPDFQP